MQSSSYLIDLRASTVPRFARLVLLQPLSVSLLHTPAALLQMLRYGVAWDLLHEPLHRLDRLELDKVTCMFAKQESQPHTPSTQQKKKHTINYNTEESAPIGVCWKSLGICHLLLFVAAVSTDVAAAVEKRRMFATL